MRQRFERIGFMNVAPDRMSFIEKGQAFDLFYLREIFFGVDARQRPGRTVLLTTVGRGLAVRRVERSSAAKIAFDREQFIGLLDRRRQRIGFEAEPSAHLSTRALIDGRRSRFTRRHRYGVIRTIRRAISASDA